jgi:hypothetical protein
MRRAAKVDANQSLVVEEFRRLGASVQCLHTVGKGCPDLLIGWRTKNYLIEVKDGPKANLTPDQVIWHYEWTGQADVIRSVADVADFMKALDFE